LRLLLLVILDYILQNTGNEEPTIAIGKKPRHGTMDLSPLRVFSFCARGGYATRARNMRMMARASIVA
jgi:hypothetical protein